ncbi:BamA/TamA family outer membrane protein [Pontibacter cellulosilyticus]|uniref:BamA/TamA family outer membrane protein n=1 Tax=Pontibacter cellulosilyticus TaxID=1720253 RepID=A0A923NAQ8_9BACT|nr:BamA/TamA family outer membrane protein [Pontibacter cellulosilyticus]MBC5994769.1 BamA/TamA family outer membrane protein [Pontibacter cellulosilyticus]
MRLRALILILCLYFSATAAAAMPCDTPVLVVQCINLSGNETTKDQVMLMELSFAPGDTIATAELESVLEENRRRLFNLRLFHYVNTSYTCADGKVQVTYDVQERFYLYPIPILDFAERNFNAWLERKDWSRIDYGLSLVRRNFRGRNEDVRLRVQRGFNKRLELSYRVPYIIRKYNLGAEFAVADYRSRTTSYTNLNNRQRFIEQQDELPIQRTSAAAGIIHRQSVQRQQGIRLSYHNEQISDSVSRLNPDYYRRALQERQYMRLELYKVVNLRNNFVYPTTGSYFEAGVAQTFFMQDSGDPFTTARAKYAQYAKLSDKLFYMVGAEGQLRLAGKHAFADNIALGYRSYVRGYELYIVGGQHYGLFKQGLTRQVLDIKSIKLKFIDNPKFNNIPLSVFLNAFTDAGYVVDDVFEEGNPLTNYFMAGGGLGLHVVTFYDMVLRLEYTVNREGNRGLYFSTRIPF